MKKSIKDTVKNITSQINHLSLNDAIESARVGETGKGFAVVANEIKNLVSDTSISTKEIEDIIQEFNNIINASKVGIIDVKKGIIEMSDKSLETAEEFDNIEDSIKKNI